MKKTILILSAIIALTSSVAFAAKYQVNTSGVVKSSGKVVSSPSNAVNQNYYNTYANQTYVSSNIVNSDQVGVIEIVMDYSGSMANWIGVAKRSMASIVAQIPTTTNLGFRVFGHDNYGSNSYFASNTLQEVKSIVKKGKKITVITQKGPTGSTTGVCSATKQVTAVSNASANAILAGMNSVDIGGATPMVYALDRAAYEDFAPFDTTTPKKIVLITDGGENCGGDPCEFARRLMQKRSDIHIDVVLVSSYTPNLMCLASTTGGHFYNINNLSDFSTVMNKSLQSQPSTVPNQIQQPSQNYEFINDDEY